MIKRITLFAALASAGASAHADTRIGAELGRTLVGVDGPGVRAAFPGFDLEAVVSGSFTDREQHQLDGELRALVPLRRFDDGWIGIAAGVAIGHRSGAALDPNQPNASTWARGIEAGLHAEWFATPALSLGFDVGFARTVGPGDLSPFAPDGNATAHTALGRPTGGASLTYWFGGGGGRADRALRFGLGATAGTEASGLTADLGAGRFLLEAALSADRLTFSEGRVGQTSASLAGYAELARRDRVALLGGVRVDLYRTTPSALQIASIEPELALPVRIQVDVATWLSLDAEVAVEIFRVAPGESHGAQLIPPTPLSAGFTAWF